jgi:hypothetical protein
VDIFFLCTGRLDNWDNSKSPVRGGYFFLSTDPIAKSLEIKLSTKYI